MISEVLAKGDIEIEGRLVDASNATLLVTISYEGETLSAIYKPVSGERPLWDFPDGNLAQRERAAYLISEAMNIHCVPLTILRDGPFGLGMVQQWIDIDESVSLENYFRLDLPELRRVALFDAVINNTDRKIGHLIPTSEGNLLVCDHGVTFHHDEKLRTVLWQWAGESLSQEEISRLVMLEAFLDSPDSQEIRELISAAEYEALVNRVKLLLVEGKFPHPREDWPHIPWPPF